MDCSENGVTASKEDYQEKLNLYLNEACFQGDLEAVKYWLTCPEVKQAYGCQADIEAQVHLQHVGYEHSCNPLGNACRMGHVEVAKYLLTSPEIMAAGGQLATIEGLDGRGMPLVWACYGRQFEVVKFLLADPAISRAGLKHATIQDRFHALYYACFSDDAQIVEYLLTSPEIVQAGGRLANIEADINDETTSALQIACEHNCMAVINYLFFEYGLQRTPLVASVTEKFPGIDQIFHIRQSYQSLEHILDPLTQSSRKKKI